APSVSAVPPNKPRSPIVRSLFLSFALLAACGAAPNDVTPPPEPAAPLPATPSPALDAGAPSRTDGAVGGVGAVRAYGVGSTAPPAAISDDFEGATLDGSRWAVLGAEGNQAPQPGTALLDGVRAHGGKQSLHIHDGFIQTRPPGTSFYG